MCRTYVENLIGFRCSDEWQDYYFEKMMTPFHSPSYPACRDRLADGYSRLERAIEEIAVSLQDVASSSPGHVQDTPKRVPEPLRLPRSSHTRIP